MTIRHRNGTYPIHFRSLAETMAGLPPEAVLITDETVHRLYLLGFDDARIIVLPPGEATKRLHYFEFCLERLAELHVTRKSTLVAFGGGVIGDLAGFVAAAYMRGVPYVQIPSTLLAQVDSSVGGKVGIDLKAGKNLAGAFFPPSSVYICEELLATLDERQFRNGMAEVWKYGFIADADLVERLPSEGLKPASPHLGEVIRRCLEIKAWVVGEDEFEISGLRATLNFGHTVGHAIEHATGYAEYLHGEAISIGMVAEAELGELMGITTAGTASQVRRALDGQGLPVTLNHPLDPKMLINSMRSDKKRTAEGLAFSLLTSMGACKLVHGVAESKVEQALEKV